MRVVEYTVNVGGYDPVRDYGMRCVSDVSLFRNDARNSRLPKILAHKFVDADVSIYWDANKEARVSQGEIIALLGDADMLITTSRKTLSMEVEAARGRVNDPEELSLLMAQGAHYEGLGLGGLMAVGFQPLVRRHSLLMERFCEAWWAEMCRWSYRDQVSFPVVARMFPELKLKEVELGHVGRKLYAHGRKTYPKVWR